MVGALCVCVCVSGAVNFAGRRRCVCVRACGRERPFSVEWNVSYIISSEWVLADRLGGESAPCSRFLDGRRCCWREPTSAAAETSSANLFPTGLGGFWFSGGGGREGAFFSSMDLVFLLVNVRLLLFGEVGNVCVCFFFHFSLFSVVVKFFFFLLLVRRWPESAVICGAGIRFLPLFRKGRMLLLLLSVSLMCVV